MHREVALSRLLPHAQLAILPGTDHAIMITRADWLVPMVEAFLNTPMPAGQVSEEEKQLTGIHVLKLPARSSCYRNERNLNRGGQKNMSKETKTKSKSGKNNGTSGIVWFEIPADNVERARTFYGKLFGWKIDNFPGSTQKPYWLIDTGSA